MKVTLVTGDDGLPELSDYGFGDYGAKFDISAKDWLEYQRLEETERKARHARIAFIRQIENRQG